MNALVSMLDTNNVKLKVENNRKRKKFSESCNVFLAC